MNGGNRVLKNTRRLLDTVATDGAMSIARLAETLQIPRSTVSRLASGLATAGLVVFLPDQTIELASRWLRLSDGAGAARAEWQSARALARRIAEATDCTCVLCVHHSGAALCIDLAPGSINEVLQAKVGRRLPLHAGAEGRAILCGLSEANLDALFAEAPFRAFTPATMTTSEELAGDLARTRRQGFTISLDDAELGVGSVGVPVRDPIKGQPGSLAILSVSEEILARGPELGQVLLGLVTDHQLYGATT